MRQIRVLISGYTSGTKNPVVDLGPYLKDAEACEAYLLEIIKKPLVDIEKPKPVEQLLRNICYLAFQPIKVEVEERGNKLSADQLIQKFERSAQWEKKVKEYIEHKDFWVKYIFNLPDKKLYKLPPELGQRPADIVYDQTLD